jgi:hypothetical protein
VKCSTATPRRICQFVLAVAAMAVILSCRLAQADLIYTDVFTGNDFTIQVSNAVTVAGGLEAVTLRAVGKNGALPNTFDSSKDNTGGTGISATALHQVWPYDALATPTRDMSISITQTLDSHFLINTANLLTVVAPSEDRTLNHLYDPWGGFGTFMKGTFTDLTAVSSTWDFAYLVVPQGTTVHLDFAIGASGFDSENVSGSFTVPEPSSLGLLAASVIGLLICRRRSAV